MSSLSERALLLESALAEALPASRAWTRNAGGGTWWVEVSSPTATDGRRLTVELRPDGDVDVRFYVGPSGIGRGPYEAQWPVPEDQEPEVMAAVARFVAALVDERLVLAHRRAWLGGGREFVEPGELTPARRRRLDWVASWRGTYDWANPR